MGVKKFYLMGGDPTSVREIDIGEPLDMKELQTGIAGEYKIVRPEGVGFQNESSGHLSTTLEIQESESAIGITVDGHPIKTPLGPGGLPIVGSYYSIFPDHLGNHARLFAQYGSVIKTTNMGRTTFLTNDPETSSIAYSESEFFTKATSNPNHPLNPIQQQNALFLCDTDSPAFKIAHKFLPPSMSPKAVRHYTPLMQKTVESSYPVFDELDNRGEAFNVFQYMFKLASQTIGKFALDLDLHHFDSVDAPLHPLVSTLAQILSLNKKVAGRGDWYAHLPFGDPKALREAQNKMLHLIEGAIANVKQDDTKDLPLQDAALSATCIVDYLLRATDDKGDKLPHEYILANMTEIAGAGFTTTASLLSWLTYSLCHYPGNQERLLQELVDAGVTPDTKWTYELTNSLPFLDKFIKETQRLHNPSFQPGRCVKRDCILPGGYALRAGDVLIPNIPAIHNNPAFWSNPHRFEPDRWDTEEVKNRHKAAYAPFAAGPRGCIGFNFALQEVKVLLPSLVYRYRFEDVGEEPVEYDPEFQLIRPVNLYCRAVRRMGWPGRTGGEEGKEA